MYQTVSAQEGPHFFERDTPVAFQNITLRPDVVAFGDITNNGFDDIIFAENGRNPQFLFYNPDSNAYFRPTYENFLQSNGNTRNLPNSIVSNFGSIAILDISGDGNNDVAFFSSRFGSQAFITTWRDTIMTQISSTAGLENVSFRGTSGLQFGDINNDGKLDFHMSSEAAQNIRNWLVYNIFNQNNDGFFNDGDDDAVLISAATRSNYLFDFNNDGRLDLYVNNGNSHQDEFYRGSANGFRELGGHVLTEITNSFGSAIGDYNNNGLLDIYRTEASNARNALFINNGDFNFTKTQNQIIGLERLDSRNAMWADFDNNGWLDLAVAENGASVSLYKNESASTFTKLDQEQVMNFTGNWRHVIFFDLNQNGKLDLLTSGKQNNNSVTVYRNITEDRNWIGIKLSQTNAYYSEAFGSKLRLSANINGQQITQTRALNPFTGRFVQHPTSVHFGLDNANSASLEITWPSGQITNHNLGQNEINSYITIEEPAAGKLNQISENIRLTASLREETRDTLYFENIGLNPVTISNVESEVAHIHVEEFSTTLPVRGQGYIAIRYSPTTFDDLQVRTDSVIVISDAIQTRFPVTFKTDGRTNPAEFELAQADTVNILNRSDGHQQSIWADFTGNGLKDVIILIENENNRLYFQTDRGKFEHQPNSIISREGRFVSGGTVGDYNRNGNIDVFLTNLNGDNHFYRNLGEGQFERAQISGIAGRIRNSTGASFYDISKNGYLDLFITNSAGQTNEVLLFQNDSTYTRINAGEISSRNNYAISHLIKDLDGDGYPEIIIANRATSSTQSFIEVYKGEPGSVFNRIQVPGLTDAPYQSAGILSGDFNLDGKPDLFFLNDMGSMPMRMYQNTESLTFERINTQFFDEFRASPSDAVLIDYNRNGFSDIFLTDSQFNNSNIFLESINGSNFIRINAGELVTRSDRSSISVAPISYFEDGKTDLFITNYFNNNELFTNKSEGNNWISVLPLSESRAGKAPILIPGTKIRVTANINGGERTQTKWLGSEYLFSPVLGPVHFGIGNASSAFVEVFYPDGATESISVNEVNQQVTFSVPTSVEQEESLHLPSTFNLKQNYPNPFNPVTNISIELPVDARISLRVYNTLGQQVQVLYNGQKTAGTHTIVFDASHLPSGLYLAVLETPNNRIVRKMTLVK